MGCVSLFLRYQILAVVAVIAVVCFKAQENTPPPFLITIGGVSPGMTRAQVDEVLGEESEPGRDQIEYVVQQSLLSVDYDEADQVESVSGTFIEVDGISMKPASAHDIAFAGRLETIIGKANKGSRMGEESWASHSRYSALGLTVSSGCAGIYFRLGTDPNESHYVSY